MDHLLLRSRHADILKKQAYSLFPEIKSSHLSEAIAKGLGFNTHAALRTAQKNGQYWDVAAPFDLRRFTTTAMSLGYEPDIELRDTNWRWTTIRLWDVICTRYLGNRARAAPSDRSWAPAHSDMMVALEADLSQTEPYWHFSLADVLAMFMLIPGAAAHFDDGAGVFDFWDELKVLSRQAVEVAANDSWRVMPVLDSLFITDDDIKLTVNDSILRQMVTYQLPTE